MEETLQQEKQESEYKNPNEDQGGIRRRLRDRDLLRKRKAEALEKETNQVESQRKRQRAESGAKQRGRPRKTEPMQEISVIQEEAAATQEAPAVVVVPEPAEVIPDQVSLSPLLAVESQPAPVLAAPAPLLVFGSAQNPLFAPSLTFPGPVNPTPPLFSPSFPAPSPTKVVNTTPNPVQDFSLASAADAVPVPVPVPDQDPVPAAAADPAEAPPQVETLYVESEGREALAQVLIEDLGPDEEEDISPSQDKGDDEDLSETPLTTVPEQNKMFSVPTLSSPPPPQEYLPGNSF
ncbi:uncharacterized protein hemgn isoform X2 [Pempheris klunzingeri]|uniref:uncharacterized protein hemgn isoform X2 n=1 Tax=Pempheris klunzingeri TaxID=3127111 RepID=UPI00397EBD48